ncbi:MAG: MFS transporter [Salinisphaera sp.]|jgi:FSR family fosmidomycin resistance protein-like MFS transporter|nr:MFS transporter [Salinisphaera sp.]
MAVSADIAASSNTTREARGRLAGLSWSHFLNDGAANYLPGVLPVILLQLHLSVALAGTIMAALLVGQGLQPLFGLLADRIGGRLLTALGLLGSSVGGALLGVVSSVPWLIAVLIMIGVSNALFHPQALAGVRKLAIARGGIAMSVFLIGGEVGRGVWPMLAGALVTMGGRFWLCVLVLPGLMTLPLLLRCAPALPARHADAAPIAWSAHARPLALLVIFCALRAFVIFALVTLMPLIWAAQAGSLTVGASLITVVLVVGIIGNLGGGWLSDWMGSRVILVGSLLATAGLTAAFMAGTGLWLWLIGGALGIVLFSTLPLTILIAQDILPENRSFGSGLALGLANAVGALGVIAVGPAAASWGANGALAMAVIAALAAAGIAWIVPIHRNHA